MSDSEVKITVSLAETSDRRLPPQPGSGGLLTADGPSLMSLASGPRSAPSSPRGQHEPVGSGAAGLSSSPATDSPTDHITSETSIGANASLAMKAKLKAVKDTYNQYLQDPTVVKAKLKSVKQKVQVETYQIRKRIKQLAKGTDEKQLPTVADPTLETLSYDSYTDYLQENRVESMPSAKAYLRTLETLRFVVIVLVALTMALVGFFVVRGSALLRSWRFSPTLSAFHNGNSTAAYFINTVIALSYMLVAVLLDFLIPPAARASGLPFVLAYLNGSNVSHLFTWRVVLVKAIALIFVISSGVCLEKQAAVLFIGGGVGMVCAQAKAVVMTLPKWTGLDRLGLGGEETVRQDVSHILRNIKEERIFVASGVAAGLAVATSAPIAGVFLVMEGITSFLTIGVTLRIFLCAVLARFFADLALSDFSPFIITKNLLAASPELFPPGFAWRVGEIFAFFLISVFTGLIAAGGTWLNFRIHTWRRRVMYNQGNLSIRYVIDTLFWTAFTATIFFVIPYMFSCRPVHDQCDNVGGLTGISVRCEQLYCETGYYSEVGSLIYIPPDQVVRILFDRSVSAENEISIAPLIVYGLAYFLMMTVTFGIHVPGGLFLPSVLAGGFVGRAWGAILIKLFPNYGINAGVYAVLGAAGMWGAFQRLGLPVVVMLVEMTGDTTYLLPITVCTFTAKLVADRLYPGINALHMSLEGVPVLGEIAPPASANLFAKDVIPNTPVNQLKVIDTIHNTITKLFKSKHAVIPVTDMDGTFCGLISRRAVIYAIKKAETFSSKDEALEAELNSASFEEQAQLRRNLEEHMTSWHDTTDHALTIHDGMEDRMYFSYINLRPYTDTGPLVAYRDTPCKRLHFTFRRMGASHIAVVDENYRILGVITRRNLLTPPKKP